jgi:hypothetical protein
VTHDYNPSTQETEAGGSRVPSQLGLSRIFKASLPYRVRPWLKKKFLIINNSLLLSLYFSNKET